MFNECEVAEKTFRTLEGVLKDVEHELIFVNDGSADSTKEILENLLTETPQNRIVNFSRNFGHQAAFSAGLLAAKGDAVVIIDGDLQDPPALILEMIKKWHEGYQVVYAQRKSRTGESWFKKTTAKIFYRLLQGLANIDIPPDTGDFRLMDRCVVDQINALPERSRFLRGLVCWVGYKRTGILYDRAERAAGYSKYPLRKMLKFALDGITSFSSFPLRLSFIMGLIVTFIAFCLAVWSVVEKFLYPVTTSQGWTSLIVSIIFLGGAQLICIGILGEYIGRIYEEVKQRPLFIEVKNEHSRT
ncbi:glycosyl transferase [Fibrobacterales bacterium]|nr:glycosyl transferase [Fibrobacterales bacterium]